MATGTRPRRWLKRLAGDRFVWISGGSVFAVLLLLIVVAIGVTKFNGVVEDIRAVQSAQGALARQSDTERIERIRSTCVYDNVRTTQLREGAHDAVKVFELFVPPGSPNYADLQRFIAATDEAARRSYPYRDCSPNGIDAYYGHPPSDIPCEPDGKGFCK